jgi:fructokinase
VGELLWDLLPDGARLGGAPFNATANLRRLGHDVRFATAVGADELGRRAREAAVDLGVGASWIKETERAPTGTVDVELDEDGSPRFAIRSPAAYEELALDDADIAAITAWGPGAMVFGTLAQRFPAVSSSARRVIEAAPVSERLYDVNLRDGCWDDELVLQLLPLATVVKVNADEAAILGRLTDTPDGWRALGETLAMRYGTRALCVTRGPDGAALWLEGAAFEVAGIPTHVVDAVGAGDAFAAGLLDGLLRGRPPAKVLERANRLGALVASRSGALPEWSVDELDEALSER